MLRKSDITSAAITSAYVRPSMIKLETAYKSVTKLLEEQKEPPSRLYRINLATNGTRLSCPVPVRCAVSLSITVT